MAFLEWTKNFSMGDEVVDEQHQRLFDMLNRLHESVVQGQEQSALVSILDEMVDYTVYHFKTEEEMFAGRGYPGLEAHKLVHDDLTRQAVEL